MIIFFARSFSFFSENMPKKISRAIKKLKYFQNMIESKSNSKPFFFLIRATIIFFLNHRI